MKNEKKIYYLNNKNEINEKKKKKLYVNVVVKFVKVIY
jgi:hypothetical protein